jgi:tetratricopeptide (TPR) repeat protein
MANDDRETDLLMRWHEIHDQGTDLSPEELCADCPELLDSVKREIEKLKRLDALRTGAIDFEAAPPVVSGYEVLGVLGRGGMGVVYQARHVQLNRLVALKMLRAGRHAAWQEVQRFRTETEAVARVQHPNIVQIHDVGEAEGQPYFAMEFVGGGTLGQKLAGTPLSAHQGAGLVETLARAVHTAHEHGIIHRDLKPTNVLLTGEGVPKVTDFGLARLLDVEAGRTQTGAVLGTPAYMAPEQAAGQTRQLSPAVDVYALGAILYELLTGRPPFKAVTALETLDLVRAQEPVPPRRMQPRVPRDLETICLQCLQKEATKRYATALALADDLRRFGNGEPIRARPVPAWAQAWKWAKRRPALASLLGVCLAAALGLGVATVALAAANQREQQAREQADHNLRLARDAVDKTVTKIAGNPLLKQANFHQLRQDLLEYLVPFYEEFVKQRGNDPELEAERGQAWRSLAYLRDEMGQKERAHSEYEQVRAIFAQLSADFPAVPRYRQELAKSHNSVGVLLVDLGKRAEAEIAYRDALTIQAQLAQDFPAVPEYREDLAAGYNDFGVLMVDLGKPSDAETAYRGALKIYAQLAREFPGVPQYRQELGKRQNSLGNLLRDLGKKAEAETAYHSAVTVQAQLAQDFPAVPQYRAELAKSQKSLGLLLRNMDKLAADAEPAHRSALKVQAQLAQDFPAVPEYRDELGASHGRLGDLLVDLGKRAEAESDYRAALRIWTQLAQDFPAMPEYRWELAKSHRRLGRLLVCLGKRAEAESAYRAALRIRMQLAQDFPTVPRYRRELAQSHNNLGDLLRDLGQRAEAETAYRDALAIQAQLAQDFPTVLEYHDDLAATMVNQAILLRQNKELDRARQLLEEARRHFQANANNSGFRRSYDKRRSLAHIFVELGEHAVAAETVGELIQEGLALGNELYEVACIFACCVPLAERDTKLSEAQRKERAQTYADRALATLRQAVQNGYQDADRMKKDTDLDSLRLYPEFQKIMRELEFRNESQKPLSPE